MQYSTHFNLIGGSSVEDHGRFVFENYIGELPFHDDPNFVTTLRSKVKEHDIDAIYPAMDSVAETCKEHENDIGCRIIGSSSQTNSICASKELTYSTLKKIVPVPKRYKSLENIDNFPIFIKPDHGYGSRNTFLANNKSAATQFLDNQTKQTNFLFLEYLPGQEYTIDCFTNRHGELLFYGPRKRARISNGISVNTKEAKEYREEFYEYATNISKKLNLRGSWFFQMKKDKNNNLKLLEVAARLGGSSALFRSRGVNFALLSVFDCFDVDVDIIINNYDSELDRALSNKYNINIDFDKIYLDFDDCLIVDGKVNTDMIRFIYAALNKNIEIILITKHADDIYESLNHYRLGNVFSEILHLSQDDEKHEYIEPINAIFIDYSHSERKKVMKYYGIPVFSPDMIESIM
jgi:hypothetical protein